MIKVIYFIDRYYPNDDSFIEEIKTKYLPANGYQITIVARCQKYKKIRSERWNGADVIMIPSKIKYFSELRHIKIIRNILFKKWDIIQVRNDPLFALLCLDKNFIFQLTHLKAEEFIINNKHNFLSLIKALIDLTIRKIIIRKASLVISMSKTMTTYLKDKYKVQNVYEIPMGIADIEPDEKKRDVIIDKYNLSGKIVFIYSGSMNKARHLDILLHAYKKIESSKTALMMLGDAPNQKDVTYLKEVAKKLNTRSVIFIGRVPRNDVPGYLAAANIGIAVVPSTISNRCMSPTKTIEYLNIGIPVIASDVPDQMDIINITKSGVICKFTVSDIAKKMDSLIQKRASLESMGLSGKKFVRENRNYPLIAQNLISYYKICINQKGIVHPK